MDEETNPLELNDVNPSVEGPVMPSIPEDQPLPGQPDPEQEKTEEEEPLEPQPGENIDEDKTVPLAALHEERSRRQELQAELEVLKQVAGDQILFDINGRPVRSMPGQQQPQPQQPGQAPNQTAQELEKLWETDPRKAVQVEIMAAMSWRDNQDAQVDTQMLQAQGKYDDFNQYEPVIRQYIRALPLEERSKQGVVDLAYYVVKGQNANNAVERARQEMLQKMKAGQGAQALTPGTKPSPARPKGDALTEEQMKVADAMGLSPEQYKNAMKK
jgi:hypothetical protein